MYERDMREEFQDVPWQQGRLLITNNTRRLSKERRADIDDIERCMAFAYFSAEDEGRGRQYVHQFRSHDECVAAVEVHNAALEAANVQAQGRCAALSRSVAWSAVLGDARLQPPSCQSRLS